MGKVYKNKKSKDCALCKPHKHGWAPKKKAKIIVAEKEMDKEIIEVIAEVIDPDYGLELRPEFEEALKRSLKSKERIPVEKVAKKLGLKW